MEVSPYGNLCVALCSATKTTANITKTTENDRGGKEIKEISKKVTCSYMVSDLAYSAGACVEQLHLFLFVDLNKTIITYHFLRLVQEGMEIEYSVNSRNHPE